MNNFNKTGLTLIYVYINIRDNWIYGLDPVLIQRILIGYETMLKRKLYIICLGRMALLVTLFLVLVNIFNNVTTNTPKVLYIRDLNG